MIVFAAHVPHTPLLLPSIGKDNLKRVRDTRDAMERAAEELYATFPETIVVLSAHGVLHERAFSINLHDTYRVDLKEFGDLSTDEAFKPDMLLIDRLQRALRRSEQPFTLDSDTLLDYGTAVPLLLLTKRLPDIRIIPVSYGGLDAKAHYAFGRALREALQASDRRVAIISSGDLSHTLSSNSPGGFHPEGEPFDEAVLQAVEHMSASQLLAMDPEQVREAAECGYRPLLMLFGALDGMNARPRILSYEAPFGVGYLVAAFEVA